MKLPKEFEDDEVREGFYINGMMKKIWAAQVDALDFLNAYCKKHGLRWFMAYGSLLGIVRHHGFIPWDDDCDIWMPREDFNHLIKLLNNEKNCDYSIRETRLADYTGYSPILSNSVQRISFKKNFLEKNRDVPYATTIDLFVLDYVARDREDEDWRDDAVKVAINLRLMLESLDVNEDGQQKPNNVEISDESRQTEKESKAWTITIDELEKRKQENAKYQVVLNELDKFLLFTNHHFSRTEPLLPQVNLVYTGLISYFHEDEADLVRVYPNDLYNNFSGHDKHFFDKTVELPFEGRMYPVPADYEKLLCQIYGDYQKKIIGTATHNYPFFSKFENDILEFNELHTNPFYFELKIENMPNNADRIPSPKTGVQKLLSVLTELQYLVDDHLTAMDASAIEEVSRDLQNAAVQIGNQIEKSRDSDHICISAIQAYCEQIYQCFDKLTRGELTVEDLQQQHDLFLSMKNRIQSDYLDRKEILFLLDRSKNWKAMESLWKTFSMDPSCDVYFLMMPFFYKNADTSLKDEKYQDSTSGLPADVQLVTEESYSIAMRHPDLIVTVNGYDYYNYVRSVPPEFYTSILWKYTDQLVYIPWFKIDAFTPKDPQWCTVKYFAQIPGVLYADKTIVQSEPVRNLYINAAEEMDPDIPESYWNEKIVSWGSPLDDTEDSRDHAENIYWHLLMSDKQVYRQEKNDFQ